MANEVCSVCGKAIVQDELNGYWWHVPAITSDVCPAFGNPQPRSQTVTMHQPLLASDPRTFPCHDCDAAALASCVDVVGHEMQGYHHSRLNQARLAVETNGGSK